MFFKKERFRQSLMSFKHRGGWFTLAVNQPFLLWTKTLRLSTSNFPHGGKN